MSQQGDTKDRLIGTMMRLMWQDGYGAVGIERICTEAGVNRGSLYHFFASKEQLAIDTLEATWQLARAKYYDEAFDPKVAPLERINRFVMLNYDHHKQLGSVEWTAEQGCPFVNMGAEIGNDNLPIRSTIRDIYERERRYFEQALADAITGGDIPEQDAELSSCVLVALLTGLFVHAKVYNNIELLRQFAEPAARIIGAPVVTGELASWQSV